MAFIIAILALIPLLLGVFLMLASVMPTFGGGRNDVFGHLVAGLLLFIIGLSAIFYAGSWL